MTVNVRPVSTRDLTWSFRDGQPRYHYAENRDDAATIDPFPCYAHDLDIVNNVAAACRAHWPTRWPVTYHVAEVEDVARTNGWSTYTYGPHPDGDEPWLPDQGHIFLSGKRIPPHPAVTRYVTAHEYGHQVQWWIQTMRGTFGEPTLIDEYAHMRGVEKVARYGGGVWHRHVEEIFACDFRVLVVGAELSYWPHQGIAHPHDWPPAGKWWADAAAERWMHERAAARATIRQGRAA